MTIAITRIFKSGDALVVHIPKDMTPVDVPHEAQIEWSGGVWTVRPLLHRRSLAGLIERFKAFSPDFMVDGRELHVQKAHDGSGETGA